MNAADQQRLIESARQLKRWNNSNLRYGAKVQFKHSKTGAIIEGTFVRMRVKYAEVMSNQDKFGLPHANAMRWTVPPEMLIPVAAKV